MKTIEVTDEQYDALVHMSNAMAVQDNAGTANPLFCVYQKEKVMVPEGYGDGVHWHDGDGNFIDEEDIDDDETIKEYCEEHPEDKDLDAEDILKKLGYEKFYYKIEDVPAPDGQVYFTHESAQEHIRRNHYHYHEPFVFVNSAWRNDEMQLLMDVVAAITGGKRHQ